MYTKLIQFTLVIPINNRLREFNFRQRSSVLFDGNTTDERGERYYFTLLNENNRWVFGDQLLPAWLKNNETIIIEAMLVKQSEQ